MTFKIMFNYYWIFILYIVVDPCAASPCTNNGTCISLGPFNYTCQCPSGYNDTYCENETVVIQDTASDSPRHKVSGSTITISVTGVLLVVFMVAFMISTTLLLLLMIKQKRKSQPLSSECFCKCESRMGIATLNNTNYMIM